MSIIRYALCAIFTLAGLHASAGVINNGDFIQFDVDGVLPQGINIPSTASKLSFDFAFSTDATSGSFPGFEDSFAAVLETSPDGDVLDIFVVDVFGVRLEPSDELALLFPSLYPGLVQIDDIASDTSVSIGGFPEFAGGTSYSGRITLSLPSEVLGESATLTFRMLNPNPAVESLAALDNVSVTSNNPIPEPSSFALWLGATAVMLGASTRRRRKAVEADSN